MDESPSKPGAWVTAPWLRRHRLVWIAPGHHAAVSADIHDGAVRSVVADWLSAGRPFVVRQQAVDPARIGALERVAVGMPLPLVEGKRRIALTIAPEWIAQTAPLPLLSDVISRLPQPLRGSLLELNRCADAIELTLRVYGSAAWEALTGCAYLTPRSDVDLLLRPSTQKQLASAVAMLARWEAHSGVRADGEILFGDDDAVAWREWMRERQRSDRDGPGRVLVKSISGARLEAPDRLLARLLASETHACTAV